MTVSNVEFCRLPRLFISGVFWTTFQGANASPGNKLERNTNEKFGGSGSGSGPSLLENDGTRRLFAAVADSSLKHSTSSRVLELGLRRLRIQCHRR